MPEPTDMKPAGCGALFLLVLAIALVWASSIGSAAGMTQGPRVCEQFVEDRLRAPATAEFPRTSDYKIIGADGAYTVDGYVDAENGFGALIRSNWTCEIQDTGDDTWDLVSLTSLH